MAETSDPRYTEKNIKEKTRICPSLSWALRKNLGELVKIWKDPTPVFTHSEEEHCGFTVINPKLEWSWTMSHGKFPAERVLTQIHFYYPAEQKESIFLKLPVLLRRAETTLLRLEKIRGCQIDKLTRRWPLMHIHVYSEPQTARQLVEVVAREVLG